MKSNSYKTYLLKLVQLILGLYILLLLGMYFLQEKLLFFPQTVPLDYNYNFEIPYEEKFFVVNDLKIHSLHFKASNPKGLILYFHGNGCELSRCSFSAVDLVKRTGWNVLIIDYPGYGKSEGKISSQAQLDLIAKHSLNLASDLGFDKIMLFGRSLGSGVALGLASNFEKSRTVGDSFPSSKEFNFKFNKPLHAIILETPYLSIKSLALSNYPFVPSFLLKYPFRSDLNLPMISSPVFIVHGDQDQLIPVDHARKLKTLNPNVTYLEISNGHHDDLSFYEKYWDGIVRFIENIENSN